MYDYKLERSKLFTDTGQRMLLRVRDAVQQHLKTAGAVRAQEALTGCGGGDSWTMLACLDRLVELGEIREITQPLNVAGQHRVFVSTT